MGRQKGSVKTGGRVAGTPNKVTKKLRCWIFELVQNNIESLESDLNKLEPKERWAIIERLLPYIIKKELPDYYGSEYSKQDQNNNEQENNLTWEELSKSLNFKEVNWYD